MPAGRPQRGRCGARALRPHGRQRAARRRRRCAVALQRAARAPHRCIGAAGAAPEGRRPAGDAQPGHRRGAAGPGRAERPCRQLATNVSSAAAKAWAWPASAVSSAACSRPPRTTRCAPTPQALKRLDAAALARASSRPARQPDGRARGPRRRCWPARRRACRTWPHATAAKRGRAALFDQPDRRRHAHAQVSAADVLRTRAASLFAPIWTQRQPRPGAAGRRRLARTAGPAPRSGGGGRRPHHRAAGCRSTSSASG